MPADTRDDHPEEKVSVLNRSPRRLASAIAVGALGIAIALGTTACSAGKISQTANQEPAVNGASGTAALAPSIVDGKELTNGSIAVRNVHVLYPVDKAAAIFGDGGPFQVAFLVANDSPSRSVRLESITAKTGSLKITPPADAKKDDPAMLAPTRSLQAGEPAGAITAADGSENFTVPRFDVQFTNTADTVAAGLTVPLTFTFSVYDLAGKKIDTVSTTILTPVDGGTLPERQDTVRDLQDK